ncbi:MAG: phosphoribosylformylglycinamidine synthase subunit PurS [Methyloligellaceae bacterium]
MRAIVKITLKNGVLDPQGKAIEGALNSLGFDGIESVRQGKIIELDLEETEAENAEATVAEMCEKLLANTVIENYSFELVP